MKKFLLTGLGAMANETGIRSWLNAYGPVCKVEFVREGDAKAPVALVEMDITDGQAANLVSRIQHYWHDGYLVSARSLIY
jgi:hypothetical protein